MQVTQADVKLFFESVCGEVRDNILKLLFLLNVLTNICKECTNEKFFFLKQVYRLRLLGDYHHSTRIAFVEFVMVIAIFSLFVHAKLLVSTIYFFPLKG